MRVRLSFLICVVALGMGGCAAIGNPLGTMRPDYADVPAQALKDFALEVERVVKLGDRDFELDAPGITTTDGVLQAIRTRCARSELIEDFLDQTYAWERRNGLIETKRTRGYKDNTTRRERDRFALLVMNENNSRWIVYEGLVKANNWPARSLSAVQDAFYQARVETLSPGQLYEGPGGEALEK